MTNTVDTGTEAVGRDVALLLAMAQAHQYPGAPILRMVAAAYEALAAERDEYVRLHSEMGVRCRKAREERDRLAAERNAAVADARVAGDAARAFEEESKRLAAENARLRSLVETMLTEDPMEPIADGGVVVLDQWRKDALRILGDTRHD